MRSARDTDLLFSKGGQGQEIISGGNGARSRGGLASDAKSVSLTELSCEACYGLNAVPSPASVRGSNPPLPLLVSRKAGGERDYGYRAELDCTESSGHRNSAPAKPSGLD